MAGHPHNVGEVLGLDDAIAEALPADGDYGDIVVSADGSVWSIDPTVATATGRAVMSAADAAAGRAALVAAATVHGHAQADVTNLVADLAAKADLVGGVIPSAQIPQIAITNVYPVASQAAMLALTAERGDIAIRSDNSRTYVLSTDSPATLADWLILPDANSVVSVNGFTGVVVLGASDVGAQPADAGLASIAGLTTIAGQMLQTTGADTYAVLATTAFGRALLALANAAALRTAAVIGQVTEAPHASNTYTIALTDDPIETATCSSSWSGAKTITTSGSKSEGQRLTVVVGFNATFARAITWGAAFVAGAGLTLPASTTINKKTWCQFVWDAVDSKLVMVQAPVIKA